MVEVSGSGVGVGSWDASPTLPGEVGLRAIAEASCSLLQRRRQVVNEVLTPTWELRALRRLGKALSFGERVELFGLRVVSRSLVDLLGRRDDDGHIITAPLPYALLIALSTWMEAQADCQHRYHHQHRAEGHAQTTEDWELVVHPVV